MPGPCTRAETPCRRPGASGPNRRERAWLPCTRSAEAVGPSVLLRRVCLSFSLQGHGKDQRSRLGMWLHEHKCSTHMLLISAAICPSPSAASLPPACCPRFPAPTATSGQPRDRLTREQTPGARERGSPCRSLDGHRRGQRCTFLRLPLLQTARTLTRRAPAARPLFAPSSVPALGEQNQAPEAGANSLPWTRGRKGSCGNRPLRGSGGLGHMGTAQCRLTQPGHPQGL